MTTPLTASTLFPYTTLFRSSGKGQRILLDRVSFILKQHHDHGDAEKHLRDWAEKIAAEHLQDWRFELPQQHQYGPQCQRKRQAPESKRSPSPGDYVEMKRAVAEDGSETNFKPVR